MENEELKELYSSVLLELKEIKRHIRDISWALLICLAIIAYKIH